MNQTHTSAAETDATQSVRSVNEALAGMPHPDDVQALWRRLMAWQSPLSREEAAKLLAYAEANPEIMAIYGDRFQSFDPNEVEMLRAVAEWLFLLSNSWPRTETGEPSPYFVDQTGQPADALTWHEQRAKSGSEPAEAGTAPSHGRGPYEPGADSARHAEHVLSDLRFKNPDQWKAYLDRSHLDHEAAVEAITQLHRAAAQRARKTAGPS